MKRSEIRDRPPRIPLRAMPAAEERSDSGPRVCGAPLARRFPGTQVDQNDATRLPNPIARTSAMASRFWTSSRLISNGYATEASRCTLAWSIAAALLSPNAGLCDTSRAISRKAASIGGQYCSCTLVSRSAALTRWIWPAVSTGLECAAGRNLVARSCAEPGTIAASAMTPASPVFHRCFFTTPSLPNTFVCWEARSITEQPQDDNPNGACVQTKPYRRAIVAISPSHSRRNWAARRGNARRTPKKGRAESSPPGIRLQRTTGQRLENWKDRRALARPYFLRSTTRESRV